MANYKVLFINQGTDYTQNLIVLDSNGIPANLTNNVAFSSAKTSYYTANIALVFTTSIDSANGIVTISANNQQTANIIGTLVYDVTLMNQANNKQRIYEGIIYVNPGVTNITPI